MTGYLKQAGLTLLELVLGLAIMAVLLQVALPAMAELINKQRAGSYMAQFSRHLGFARIQAANSQQPIATKTVVAAVNHLRSTRSRRRPVPSKHTEPTMVADPYNAASSPWLSERAARISLLYIET